MLSDREAAFGDATCGVSPRPATSDKQETHSIFTGSEALHGQAGAPEGGHRDSTSAISSAEEACEGSSGTLAASMLESGLKEPLPFWPSKELASVAPGLF